MTNDNSRHVRAWIEEFLDALKHNHRPAFHNVKGPYGRTLAGGEAALHAICAISQSPEIKNDSENDVKIPRWVFNSLFDSWRIFLLLGSSNILKNRKTLGQVIGCEPNFQGGREGAITSLETWNELGITAMARHIKKECAREGFRLSNEEIAGNLSELLETRHSNWPEKSGATIERYLKKYRNSSKKGTTS